MNIVELRQIVSNCDKKLTELREKAAAVTTPEDLSAANAAIDNTITERAKAEGQIELLERQAAEAHKEPVIEKTNEQVNIRSTKEYSEQFKEYLRSGKMGDKLLAVRAEGSSADLGVLTPTTISQEIITTLGDEYGKIYNAVAHTQLPCGVKYPVGSFDVNIVWGGTAGNDTEHGVSTDQKGGSITRYVEFTYHIAEARVKESLLLSVLATDNFEAEISKAIAKSVLRDWDNMIISGTGTNQPTGVLVDANVTNSISFTAAEMQKWESWHTKVFAVTPDEFDAENPEFIMKKSTWETNIMTLSDGNRHPVARQENVLVNGIVNQQKTLNGYKVTTVTATGIADFGTASSGDCFGLFWIPALAYAINGVADFGVRKYFDEATNSYVTKILYIGDGKVLNPSAVYKLVKA